ncbi:MAG: TonB-dependent receptor plug domain-containing protein [Sedimentisphaerales bacterium]
MNKNKNSKVKEMCEAKNRDCNLWRFRHIIASLLILSVVSFNALDANASDSNDLFSLSLEQLMNVDVYAAATLTEKNPLKTPACVTVITSADIARTPARNILDLMEIYVPGMLYMNHSDGPEPGIRGIITDRPYKFLVNVNGINVNTKAHYGARLELLNWELSDIDRIEVVRGPGSVTYGPGAIAGVINIYTKRGKQAPGFQFGGHYWGKYDSIGNWVSYGYHKDQFDLYSYFSIVTENGETPDLFATGSNAKVGYTGEKGAAKSYPPPTYMGDFWNQPQIKAHLDIQINDSWRFWGRYVTESADYIQSGAQKYLVNGAYRDFAGMRFRYFQLALENNRDISDNWSLKSTFGLSSKDVLRILANTRSSMNSIRNGDAWSEWEYFTRFMLNYAPKDSKLKAALGFELSYDLIRPGWGRNADNGLRLSDGIISGPGSDAYAGGGLVYTPGKTSTTTDYFPVGNGWETFTHSFIGELNYQLTPKTTMILSARMDKHSYTNYYTSPRIAFIYELKKDHYLKFIMQKSVRMNTAEELYMNHEQHKVNKPETLETLELIYSGKMTDHLSLETSVFFNRLEAIAWNATQKSATPVGTLKTIGLEIDLKYKKENFELGINHSIVKQLDFLTADRIEASGISNSDYYYKSGNVTIGSRGNDLSNWANQATKLYTNIDLFKKKVTLHGDIKAFWGFEGLADGLTALSHAIPAGDANSNVISTLRDHDAYGILATANLSLTYHVNKSADFMVFVQNIPVFGGNKRYTYLSGQKSNYSNTCWVEEPETVVGFTYKIRF